MTFLLLAVLGGCSADEISHDGPIDRETFVSVYVDLRLSALGSETGVISEAERTRVLGDYGVTGDDLEGFAEGWGADPAAMKAIWEEVQQRLRVAAGEDTTAATAVPASSETR